jgi:hypothetical protein
MQRKTLAVVLAAVVGAIMFGCASSAAASENTQGNRGWNANKSWEACEDSASDSQSD